ncbi:MAG TPA: helix-turn-helix transcriptional regulator [Candidatus Nanoarchaeia archaeon]|nr:helix-turn-helix transcriptional regulator [Candidatus Nanoarchaeia archaeon]
MKPRQPNETHLDQVLERIRRVYHQMPEPEQDRTLSRLEQIAATKISTSSAPDHSSSNDYAFRLTEHMERTGLSPQEIARNTHLGLRTVQRVAQGRCNPHLRTRLALDQYLTQHSRPQSLYKSGS